MSLAAHRSLVKPLEPSSRAAALVGPNALMPAAVEVVDDAGAPAAPPARPRRGRSCARGRTRPRAAWSATSSATISPSRAMPALPGAQKSRSTSGLAAIFQASACSRPPEPRRRMFIRGRRTRAVEAAGHVARYRSAATAPRRGGSGTHPASVASGMSRTSRLAVLRMSMAAGDVALAGGAGEAVLAEAAGRFAAAIEAAG